MRKSVVCYEFLDDLRWIRVVDILPDNNRYLHFEESVQGVLNLNDPAKPVLEYIAAMLYAAKALVDVPDRVFIGGLGTCSIQHTIRSWWFGKTEIVSVEVDPLVADLARRFFKLDPEERVLIGDLRDQLEAGILNAGDLFFIDCYSATAIPPHLMTLEFMRLVRDSLNLSGIAVFNLWNDHSNAMCGSQVRTILEAFGEAALIRCQEDQNIVIVAAKGECNWPVSIPTRNRRLAVHSLSLETAYLWPSYVREGRIIKDLNLHEVLSEYAIC